MPHHALFEFPRDRRAIFGQPTVVQAGNVCGQDRDEVGLWVKRRQWLVDHTGGIHILGAGRQVAIENGGCLPPEQAQLATTAASGWDNIRHWLYGLCLGRAIGGQQIAKEGTRQP